MIHKILRWADRVLLALICVLVLVMLVVMGTAHGATTATVTIVATVTGTSAMSPTNGTLYLKDNATYYHHTRTVTYWQHDGYSKTENLVSSSRPLGVVLKREDIENACDASLTDGSVNPPGGYEIGCGGVLHGSPPAAFPLGGDLTGRFCRVPQPPEVLHCPAMPPIHVNENATGSGPYLTVGNKDHGAMYEVDYYVNVAGVDVEVDVQIPVPLEVTRIVLLPQTGSPSAMVMLNS